MSLSHKQSIVVVNDNVLQRTVLCELLTRAGHAVSDFSSADTALGPILEAPPALIVTDLYMPGLDGWRFCRLLRSPEYPTLNKLPILVVSATFSGDEPGEITANLGANAFLSAPVNGPHFLKVVEQLLAGQSMPEQSRVLIIEDDTVTAELLAQSFASHQFLVQTASSGESARASVSAFAPNIIVLDYHLPDIKADVLLTEFRNLEPMPAIVVMTGDTNPALALRVMKLGARAYVRKPFEPAYLIAICENARRETCLLHVEHLLEKRTQELQASEERYRLLVDNIPGAVFHCESQSPWRMNHLSKGVLELTGHPAEGFLKHQLPWQNMILADDLPLVTETVRLAVAEGRPYFCEYRIRHANGQIVWIGENGQPIGTPDGTPLFIEGVMLNITERKLAEQTANSALASLGESEEKFRTLAESVPFAIMIHQDGKWIYANPAGERLSGYSAAELSRMNYWEFIHPAEQEKVRQSDQVQHPQSRGMHREFNCRILAKDGSEKLLHVTSVLVSLQSQPAVLVAAMDITEQRRLMEQLQQAQKMEAVGRLAGGVAHDFNNLLTAIKGNVALAQDILTADHEAQEFLHEIDLSANRASTLTRHLLAFSRKQLIEPKVANLNDLIKNFRNMLTRLIGEDVELQLDLAQDILPVKVDAGQMEQILLNLAVNARDAMPKGGTLTIMTTNVRLEPGLGSSHLGLRPGTYVKLTLADTGCGMSEEIRRHLFEPFFTTKPIGHGTGLGLATVYSAVRQNGGAIDVESSPGRGASFFIYLPEASAAPSVKAATSAEAGLQGSETILLAEDDASIRLLIRKLLERHGYQVLSCADGIEAMETASKHQGPIHILVTDVIMPNLNGRELHDRLRAARPNIRTLFVSGYTGDLIAQHGVLDSGINFLAKPCDPRDLLKRIRAILDEPAH